MDKGFKEWRNQKGLTTIMRNGLDDLTDDRDDHTDDEDDHIDDVEDRRMTMNPFKNDRGNWVVAIHLL